MAALTQMHRRRKGVGSLGAGSPTTVVRQILRTYGDYRGLDTEQRREPLGMFCLSLYAITGHVTREEVYAEMLHKQLGEATAGQVRAIAPLLATSSEWEGMSAGERHLQDAHFDAILTHPEAYAPDLASLDPSELTNAALESLQAALMPELAALLGLFQPRHAK